LKRKKSENLKNHEHLIRKWKKTDSGVLNLLFLFKFFNESTGSKILTEDASPVETSIIIDEDLLRGIDLGWSLEV
jgi:hypothetical protein